MKHKRYIQYTETGDVHQLSGRWRTACGFAVLNPATKKFFESAPQNETFCKHCFGLYHSNE